LVRLIPNIGFPNPLKRGDGKTTVDREKELLKKEFISEAENIKESINDVILKEKARQFFKLVRRSLEKIFSINYECTYSELKREIESRELAKELKNELRVFLEELERFEYDFPGFEDEHRSKRARERSEIMSYLRELEAEGKKVDKKITKELDDLFKDDLSDSSRLLVKYVNEFEELLAKI
jgi:hypothetical protein